MIRADDPRALSHLFHLNSEPWVGPDSWESAADRMDDATGNAIGLPAAGPGHLATLLERRYSCREFLERPLAATALGSLLGCGYGVTRVAAPDQPLMTRTVPSAGALYPLELFVQAHAVESVDDAVYRYDSVAHELRPTDVSPITEWDEVLLSQSFVSRANAVVFIAAVFDRTQRKYGPRGYRYVLLEAGHVAQNMCLCAAELGLGSICLGGFRDAKLNALLRLDVQRIGVVYAVAIGHAG